MLPTYEGRQIARKIFRYVGDIVRRSHALHGTERLYELPHLWVSPVAIERADIASVKLECRGFPPDRFCLPYKALRLGRIRMIREEDIHTAASQIDRRVAAESAASAGDDCCFVVFVVHNLLLASSFTRERCLARSRRSRLHHHQRAAPGE